MLSIIENQKSNNLNTEAHSQTEENLYELDDQLTFEAETVEDVKVGELVEFVDMKVENRIERNLGFYTKFSYPMFYHLI